MQKMRVTSETTRSMLYRSLGLNGIRELSERRGLWVAARRV
jgi:hypothetical protein